MGSGTNGISLIPKIMYNSNINWNQTKTVEMNEALIYLQEALGLSAKTKTWPGSACLPLHLRAIEVRAVDANGFSFLLASLPTGVGLPEAKRVYSQLALRAETPVVVSFPDADARQRKALVAQGIPFVCTGRQAFLPFMGTACTERGGARFRNHATKMSPNAQAAAIWGAAQEPYRPYDLCRALGISASRASEAITELVDRGIARRERCERRVVVLPVAVDLLLSEHMAELSSPVSKVFFARKTPQIDYLVDAGETALAARSMLAAPGMEQKAVLRSTWRQLSDLEVADGELSDNETAMIQVWRYAPVFAGSSRVDDISLALSLAAIDDERIQLEVDRMFGKEYPWQEAL